MRFYHDLASGPAKPPDRSLTILRFHELACCVRASPPRCRRPFPQSDQRLRVAREELHCALLSWDELKHVGGYVKTDRVNDEGGGDWAVRVNEETGCMEGPVFKSWAENKFTEPMR